MGSFLDAQLRLSRGTFALDAALGAERGEILALLGPNGAGKSTALRALAGLVPLEDGHVRVDGRDETTTPVEQRPIGMVFQDYLLFPHMSALDNVAFGPRADCPRTSSISVRARLRLLPTWSCLRTSPSRRPRSALATCCCPKPGR